MRSRFGPARSACKITTPVLGVHVHEAKDAEQFPQLKSQRVEHLAAAAPRAAAARAAPNPAAAAAACWAPPRAEIQSGGPLAREPGAALSVVSIDCSGSRTS